MSRCQTSRTTCDEAAPGYPHVFVVSGRLRATQLYGKALIEDGSHEVFVSAGSLWEMAIKISLGKLTIGQPFETFIPEQLAANDIAILPIAVEHTAALITLPFHHRDPFDRLLIAQSLVSNAPIVGADTAFDAYGIQRLW